MDFSNLDTTVDFPKELKARGLHRQVIANLKTLQIQHPTVIQASLLGLAGKKKNVVIEAPPGSGKTTGALFFALAAMAANPESKALSVGLVVPSHNFINNAYQRLFEVVKHAPIRLVNLDSEKQTSKETGKDVTTIFIGSYMSFFKCFQEDKVPVQDFAFFIWDDTEYSISLGNNHKLLQLSRYLTTKLPEEQKAFVIISGNTELESFKELKEAFGVKFTSLKLQGETEKPKTEQLMETAESDTDLRADLVRTMMRQYYYIGTDLQLVSCCYLISKFEVFRGGILVVAESLNDAYRLKIFFDRAYCGEAQVYNTEGVINIRAYNMALFNGGSIRFLIVPKEFLSDQKKNKKTVQSLKSVKNIVFFNCELDYNLYSGFLNLFKTSLGVVSAKNVEIGYKVLFLAAQKIDEELKPKEALLSLMSKQKDKFGQVLFEPLPIPVSDIDSFVYRVENVLTPITIKKIKVFRLIELKRNILKNKNMKTYFESHETEKQVLVKSLNDLTKLLEKNKNEMNDVVPFYLTPSFLRSDQGTELSGPTKIVLTATNLKKRKPNARSSERYIMIDPEREDPQFTDPTQLRSFSNRKEWKRKRGLLNKKKRLSKKEIQKGKHV